MLLSLCTSLLYLSVLLHAAAVLLLFQLSQLATAAAAITAPAVLLLV
jgi:hypothetical protein